MSELSEAIATTYGDKIRVRSSVILLRQDRLLLVRHQGLGAEGIFWAPPGGGVDFGEALSQAAIRETREETGLTVRIGQLLCISEYIQAPLHAVEFFFLANLEHGHLQKGQDPELPIIEQVKWMDLSELQAIPNSQKHQILHHLKNWDDLNHKNISLVSHKKDK